MARLSIAPDGSTDGEADRNSLGHVAAGVFRCQVPVARADAQQVERGRGTRAGGWGRGEEPGPGPTMREARSSLQDATFPHRSTP